MVGCVVSRKNVVRTGALAVVAASLVLPVFMAVPRRLPATAMGSTLLLYLERLVSVFAIFLLLLVFLYRSLVHGELPRAVSGRGAEWPEVVEPSAAGLQAQVDELAAAIEGMRRSAEAED
jgi:hypothetical protein